MTGPTSIRAVGAAFILLGLVLPPRPAHGQVEHTFIFVIDGLRASEAFGDPELRFVAPLAENLAPQGALLTAMEVRAQTTTLPAHMALVTGNWSDYANTAPFDGREFMSPRSPTLFEAWRFHTEYPFDGCHIVSNSPLVSDDSSHSLAPGYGAEYGAEVVCDWSASEPDAWVWDQVDTILDQHEVDLMLVNLHDVDTLAHAGDWEGYTGAALEASERLVAFWDRLQADPVYQDKTALLITTDHGRHLDDVETGWISHGCSCRGCREVFLLAVGPGIQPGITSDQPCSFMDIAPTVSQLMGFPFPLHRGRVLTEMLVEPAVDERTLGGAFNPVLAGAGDLLVRAWERDDPTLGDEAGRHRVVVEWSTDEGQSWQSEATAAGPDIQLSPALWTDGEVIVAGWLETEVGGDRWTVRLRWFDGQGWSDVFEEPMLGASTPRGSLQLVDTSDVLVLLETNPQNQRFRTWTSADRGTSWSTGFDALLSERHFPRDTRALHADGALLAVYSAHITPAPYVESDDNYNTEIYLIRSVNHGQSWTEPVAVSHTLMPSIQPQIAVAPDGSIHVVWAELSAGQWAILQARSDDGGASFSETVVLAPHGEGAWEPAAAFVGDRLHVAYSAADQRDQATVHVFETTEGAGLTTGGPASGEGLIARTPALLTLPDGSLLATWSHGDLDGPWELASAIWPPPDGTTPPTPPEDDGCGCTSGGTAAMGRSGILLGVAVWLGFRRR